MTGMTTMPSANLTGHADRLAVDRQVRLGADPERVWSALTEATELGTWFGTAAELGAREGAEGWVEWNGIGRFALRIEVFDAPRHLAWRAALRTDTAIEAASSTRVEWTLEPLESGGTTVMLHESGFPTELDRERNANGWFEELADLQDHLARHPWEKGIRRRLELRAAPDRVWAALTDPTELGAWWGPLSGVEIRVGSEGWFDFPEYGRHAVRVEALEPPRYFAWRWTPGESETRLADATEVCLVEWLVMPRDDGGTTLHLVETGFTGPRMFDENTGGWDEMLPVLARHLGEPA